MKGSLSTFVTMLVLLALWVGSWGLSYVDLGRWSLPVALAIAVMKAALVALVFMELLHARASVRLTLVTAIAMVGLMIGLVAVDVVARGAG